MNNGVRKRINPIFMTAALFLASCGTVPPLSTEQSIDGIMAEFNSPGAPGASVLVMKNDSIIFKKGYGLADLQTKDPITAATNFRLASVTKEFTAMCIMLLEQRGELSFDDHITKFFPDFPPYGKDITVRNLLNHTSGLVDYESLIPDSQTVQVLDADCLELLKHADTLYFPAGSKYQYSNTGYAFLALIVQKVSGKRFADFLKENIFDVAGMPTTVAFENGISTVPHRAYGHSFENGMWVQTDQSNTSAVLGDGGIYSNVEEMAKWISALYSHKFISEELQQQAWTEGRLNDGTPIDYGFGWHLETYKGIRHPAHGGSSRGFRNDIQLFPGEKLMVIILTNRNEAEPSRQSKKIADLFLGK